MFLKLTSISLHNHSDYSVLDGMGKVKDIAKRVKELGMTACALTDHGTGAGLVSFYDACEKEGIKPILGCECYEAPADRFDKNPDEYGDRYYHLILLVKNEEGYKNLCKLITRSNTEGFYYKPRIDFSLLEELHEGLICLSACVAGRIPVLILRDDLEAAEHWVQKYKYLFGDDYYIEIQNHGLDKEDIVRPELIRIAHKYGIKLVATNDSHYVRKEDREAHDWLLAMQTKKTIDDPTRMKYEGDYSILSTEEMLALFPDNPDAVYNTQEIADKCNFKFHFGDYRMPKVTLPDGWGKDYFGYLESEAWKGFEERYPEGNPEREQARKDLEYELSVIKDMGFAEYFLDTRKTIQKARSDGILVGPGRGCSGPDTLVYTNHGIKKICDVSIKDFVYDCEGKLSWVKNKLSYAVEEEVLRIGVWHGDTITYTKDHKFFVVPAQFDTNGTRELPGNMYIDPIPSSPPVWKQAKDLRPGDWVVSAIPIDSDASKIRPNFGKNGVDNAHYYEDEKYIYRRIHFILPVEYSGTVYDLTVDTSAEPSYMTTSGIVHNSAAGSRMCYCLGITDIDPIPYQLLFSRFLNPERISMPDIDVDYQYSRKDDVIRAEAESNGYDKFAKIQTFITMQAKAVVRDVTRTAGEPVSVGNQFAKLVGDCATLKEAYETNPDLRDFIAESQTRKKIWEISLKLEGTKKAEGVHACGHIPTPVPCEELFPCRVDSESGLLVCQYDMTEAEHLGNLKKDLLMLRNLTIIDIAQQMVKQRTGKTVPLWNAEILNDKDALALIASGNTNGVFQLESGGMKKFMRELQPNCFEDIIAGVALYRPGPMDMIPDYIKNKHNPDQIQYLCPQLEPILRTTYGIIVYQEQVMLIVQALAGFSMGRADLVRKAMGKKKMDIMLEERKNFVYGNESLNIPGCIKNGISEKIANEIYDQMVSFAAYAFNKSHAAAYAAIALQTAYLKAHYPLEFFAGLLTSVMDNTDKLAVYINECRSEGVHICPPDVNSSSSSFTIVGDSLVYGLSSIKGAGEGIVNKIIEDRNENGPYMDFADFVFRNPECNKGMIESLIKAGAFDFTGYNRNTMLSGLVKALASLRKSKKALAGQVSLFALANIAAPTYEFEQKPEKEFLAKMKDEKSATGFYISGHPLDVFDEIPYARKCDYLSDVLESPDEYDGKTVRLSVLIKEKKLIYTKKNQRMCRLVIEDRTAEHSAVVFPKKYEIFGNYMMEDGMAVLTCEVQKRDGEVNLNVAECMFFEELNRALWICFDTKEDFDKEMRNRRSKIAAMLNSSPGEIYPVYIQIKSPKGYIKTKYMVNNIEAARIDLAGQYGEDHVRIWKNMAAKTNGKD